MALDAIKKLQESFQKPTMLVDATKLMDEIVLKKDLVNIIKVFSEHITQIENNLDTLLKDASGAISEDVKAAKAELRSAVEQLKTNLENNNRTISEELRSLVSETEKKIEKVYEEIPDEYDDSDVRENINDISVFLQNLPKEFDPSELVERLTRLEKKVDDVKNKPSVVKGGVTDKAVQFAVMRSIKTVTPTGTINGSNTDFTVPSTIHAILGFELNSRSIDPGSYTITGSKRMGISFDTAIPASYAGKQFNIIYI